MLNLLAFWPGKEAHESYLQYGKAFGESIGKRRGGKAKIVGKVVVAAGGQATSQEGKGEKADHQDGWWDEVALAHYPSRSSPYLSFYTDMWKPGNQGGCKKKFKVCANMFVRETAIHHFTDMLASEDYQKVNHEFRLPALKDTCILCTTELDPELSIDKARL